MMLASRQSCNIRITCKVEIRWKKLTIVDMFDLILQKSVPVGSPPLRLGNMRLLHDLFELPLHGVPTKFLFQQGCLFHNNSPSLWQSILVWHSVLMSLGCGFSFFCRCLQQYCMFGSMSPWLPSFACWELSWHQVTETVPSANDHEGCRNK